MSLSKKSYQIKIKRFIYAVAILLFFASQAQGSSLPELLGTAEQLGLSNNATWRKLLHYESGTNKSEVLTKDFFIDPGGMNDPKAELVATLTAYFEPWREKTDEDVRCRFPARYFWLSKQMDLPDYNLKEPRCQHLKKWALFDTVQSVSVLSVSGYFGNPASTFGHGLLKLNTNSPGNKSNLFDLTVNYGALVPENENTVIYILRGLFGGYEAGFSDKYFYTHDLVYSRTEFRDIWEYQLELSDYERTLLILHVWEVAGKKFTYYFLDKNCVYRLSELLDIVIEESVLKNARFWYIPEEFFHRLNDIDRERQKSGERLINSVKFIPSSQRILYHQLKRLTPDELKAFNATIKDGTDSMQAHLSGFEAERQINLLDALLAYQKYRLVSEEPEPTLERREAKDKILLARLRQPARQTLPLEIQGIPAPAEGARPMEFGMGIGSDSEGDSLVRLNWSPFKETLVGQNSLDDSELVLLDLVIGVTDNGENVFVDKFDLARIKNINTTPIAVVDEAQWSWQVRIGTNLVEDDGGGATEHDGVVSFGLGRAVKPVSSLTGYGIIDLAAHTRSSSIRVRPHLGIILDMGRVRAWAFFGAESTDYEGGFRDIWGGEAQYRISRRYALRLEFSNEQATRGALGLNWYW